MGAARKPPVAQRGALAWLRQNLFSSWGNAVASVLSAAVLATFGFELLRWVLLEAHWGPVWANLKLFAVYRYPPALLWRPFAGAALVMLLLGATAGVGERQGESIAGGVFWWFLGLTTLLTLIGILAWPVVRWGWLALTLAGVAGYVAGRLRPALVRALPWSWGASLIVIVVLLGGFGDGGAMRSVSTKEWGGFMLTLILSVVGIAISFPLGIALALGRRSDLPVIKAVCVGFIEVVRGAPLIMWLFIASLMVPLVLNVSPSAVGPLTRAMVAVTLFSSAYMAENVRGGLQAVPKGQYEAAQALGLSGWQRTRLIVLPQALRAVIPAIVGQAIALFKDTSLVFIVGLFDFFNVGNIVANQNESLLIPGGVRLELSLFMAVVYWFFAYRMSVASRQLERRLGVGER
ncbi:MAG TPA: amino acid ABC transporter permease [Trueperaceae bacterium]|nr:amino acid ABC transporter permease [Trueperaceae bacterium]